MYQVLIYIYIAQVFFICGMYFNEQDNIKEHLVVFICSLFAIPILVYYAIDEVMRKLGIKDVFFFTRLLLGFASSETIHNLNVMIGKEKLERIISKRGFIYRYLGNKVIKKYNLK